MRILLLLLLVAVSPISPTWAQTPNGLLKRDLAEEIGKLLPLSSEQEDRLAALHGTMLLKSEDVLDSFGPLAEQRLSAKLKTKYSGEMAAIDAAPESERDTRSRALVRKVSLELRTELEKEMRARLRTVTTDFFAAVTKILTSRQRPRLNAYRARYLAAWDREKPTEIRKRLSLIIGVTPEKKL